MVTSSEDGLVPSPVAMYSISKAALLQLVRTTSSAYSDKLQINAIAPGLVDTPFSWNQVRGCVAKAGVLDCAGQLPAWQCFSKTNGSLIEDGDCEEGGDGFGCGCEDATREDPRQKLKWPGILWPAINPRSIGVVVSIV